MAGPSPFTVTQHVDGRGLVRNPDGSVFATFPSPEAAYAAVKAAAAVRFPEPARRPS